MGVTSFHERAGVLNTVFKTLLLSNETILNLSGANKFHTSPTFPVVDRFANAVLIIVAPEVRQVPAGPIGQEDALLLELVGVLLKKKLTAAK
jgi:hypothetical protein